MKNRLIALMAALSVIFGLASCSYNFDIGGTGYSEVRINLEDIPEYAGEPYIEINGNIPDFDEEDITNESFEHYSRLDFSGRCGTAYACLGRDTMPAGERGDISMVKPTGWQTSRYDFVDGEHLYNRCHLIGYQLSGENANERNLITGTRYMNTEGMLPFENEVAEYIDRTGGHVMYRVTPVFEDDELLARGVQMEAVSVEDGGRGVCFNVYCYNVQPGVEIDYTDGSNKPAERTEAQSAGAADYVLNTGSKKYHLPSCSGAAQINRKNRADFTGTEAELESMGYSPCGSCIGQ